MVSSITRCEPTTFGNISNQSYATYSGRLEFDVDAKKCVTVDAVVESGWRASTADGSDARRQRRPEDRGSNRGRRCRHHRGHLHGLFHRLRRLLAVLVEVQRQIGGQNGDRGLVSLPLHR